MAQPVYGGLNSGPVKGAVIISKYYFFGRLYSLRKKHNEERFDKALQLKSPSFCWSCFPRISCVLSCRKACLCVTCLFSSGPSQQLGASAEEAAVCYNMGLEAVSPRESTGIQRVSMPGLPLGSYTSERTRTSSFPTKAACRMRVQMAHEE